MRRLLGVLVVALLVLTACGGDDSSTIEGSGDSQVDHGGDHGGMDECGRPSTALELVALSAVAYDEKCLAVPADSAFTITLENRDAGVSHNVVVVKEHTDTTPLAASEVKAGPSTDVLQGIPLAAGTYHYHCSVHPTTMRGTLKVE